MKKNLSILTFIIIITGIGLIKLFNTSLDIRNDYLKHSLTSEDYRKGKEIINKMSDAYGGTNRWLNYNQIKFEQTSEWYNRTLISGWSVNPQDFEMTVYPNNENAQLKLLNGEESGDLYKLVNHQLYSQINGEDVEVIHSNYKRKIIFKNYWFQFPFKIQEASIIAYAGNAIKNGQKYNLVFATWESLEANKRYDQFLLYINKENYRIEYLDFTVREFLPFLKFSCRFTNFKKVNEMTLAHSQYVFYDVSPLNTKIKLHENHYHSINFE